MFRKATVYNLMVGLLITSLILTACAGATPQSTQAAQPPAAV
jgi:hypothetical protein